MEAPGSVSNSVTPRQPGYQGDFASQEAGVVNGKITLTRLLLETRAVRVFLSGGIRGSHWGGEGGEDHGDTEGVSSLPASPPGGQKLLFACQVLGGPRQAGENQGPARQDQALLPGCTAALGVASRAGAGRPAFHPLASGSLTPAAMSLGGNPTLVSTCFLNSELE